MTSIAKALRALGVNLEKAQKHEKALRADLREAHKANKWGRADYLRRRYLGSFDARLVAAASACKKLPAKYCPAASLWLEIAEQIDPWRGSDAIVEVIPKEKPGTDEYQYRLLLNFPPEHRVLQHLVHNVLDATFESHPSQFLLRGGVPAAVKTAAGAMQEGYAWAIEADIRNCYQSFDDSRIPELLPIPKEVTEHTITSRKLFLSLYDLPADPADADPECEFADDISEVRRGIPQGSAASPIVAEMLLAMIFPSLPKCGRVVNYADNFLILARTKDDAVSMTQALRVALMAHPAGPLRSEVSDLYAPGEPINFLGHCLTLTGDQVHIEPSQENLLRFEQKFRKMRSHALVATSDAIIRKRIDELKSYVRQWSSAFRLWDQAAIHRERYLSKTPKL